MCYVVRGFGSDLFTRCALISVTIKWQLHSLTMLYNCAIELTIIEACTPTVQF